MKEIDIRVHEKYVLTIDEAALYFNIFALPSSEFTTILPQLPSQIRKLFTQALPR